MKKETTQYLILQINGKNNPVFPANLAEDEEIDLETIRNPIKIEEISDILLRLAEMEERKIFLKLSEKEDSEEKNVIVDYYDNLASNSYLRLQKPLEINDKLNAKVAIPLPEELKEKISKGIGSAHLDSGIATIDRVIDSEELDSVLSSIPEGHRSPERIKEELEQRRRTNRQKVEEMIEGSGNNFSDLSEDAELLRENEVIRPADEGSINLDFLEHRGNLLAYISELAEIGGFEIDKDQILEEVEEVKSVNLPPTRTVFQLEDNRISLMGCF